MGPYYNGEDDICNDEPYVYKSKEHFYAKLLFKSVKDENLEEVKWLLICMNANPNALFPKRGISSMHILASMKNEKFSVEMMHLALRDCNGDPNLRSEDGLTPVHLAAKRGRCQVLKILLAFGGDPGLAEYKTSMNAEELALQRHQWQAHATLARFVTKIGKESSECCVVPCSSAKRNECEHKLLLNKLRRVFTEEERPDDEALIKKETDWYDDANKKSRPASYVEDQTKTSRAPPRKQTKGDVDGLINQLQSKLNLEKSNKASQQRSKIHSKRQARSDELIDFRQSLKTSSKLKPNTKAELKTEAIQMAQCFQSLKVKNTYFQQEESRPSVRKSILLLSTEKYVSEYFKMDNAKRSSAF